MAKYNNSQDNAIVTKAGYYHLIKKLLVTEELNLICCYCSN